MIGGIGYAYNHTQRKYRIEFGQPVPNWLQILTVGERFRLLEVSLALKWSLPQEPLVELTQENLKGDFDEKV